MMHSGQCVLPSRPGCIGASGATIVPAWWHSMTSSPTAFACAAVTSDHNDVHATMNAVARAAARRERRFMATMITTDVHESFRGKKWGQVQFRPCPLFPGHEKGTGPKLHLSPFFRTCSGG